MDTKYENKDKKTIFMQGGLYAGRSTGRAEAKRVNDDEYNPRLAEYSVGAKLSAGKAGSQADPASAENNINLDTGVSASFKGPIPVQASANVLGFGVGIGSKTFISTPLGKLRLW